MKRPAVPAVPVPRPDAATTAAETFIAGAPGKQRLPWQAPHVRADLGVAVNTRLPERLKLQVDWIAAQRRIPLRQVVEDALREHVRRELAALGLDPAAE